MERIEITREELLQRWGITAPGDVVRIDLTDPKGNIVASYQLVGTTQSDIIELERILKLT